MFYDVSDQKPKSLPKSFLVIEMEQCKSSASQSGSPWPLG